MSYIYIMTNPVYEGYVKIGSTDEDVEKRRLALSQPSGVMFPFEVYAVYETKKSLQDKSLHRLIDKLNPELRVNKKREFYKLTPSEAYEILEAIAEIAGETDKLHLVGIDSDSEDKAKRKKRPPIDYVKCGIPVGAEFEYIYNPEIKIKVLDGRHVEYKGKQTFISAVANTLLERKPNRGVDGTLYFKYKGRLVCEYYKDLYK